MSQKKSNLVTYLSISAIVIAVLVSGYIILGPKNQGSSQNQDVSGLAPMVDGKQVIQTTVRAVSYSPNSFKVRAGVPVRMEITSSGEPGCDSGVMVSNILPNGSIYLNPDQGQVTVAEFTPQDVGTYKFSCPMGMVRGTIEVIN